MDHRSATVEETRQRIVDATVKLHNEKGISATSMQDIAARAGVALGTVYRHFPSVNELIPACGSRNLEITPPPTPQIFADIESGEERVRVLFAALYKHFEEAKRPYTVGFAEAISLPVVKAFMDQTEAYLRSLVAEAAESFAPAPEGQAFAFAMADFRTWQAFQGAGLNTARAAQVVSKVLVAHLSREGSDS